MKNKVGNFRRSTSVDRMLQNLLWLLYGDGTLRHPSPNELKERAGVEIEPPKPSISGSVA